MRYQTIIMEIFTCLFSRSACCKQANSRHSKTLRPHYILPAGISADDLEPTVSLAHELVKNGIQREKIIVVFCLVRDSYSEIEEARSYISMAGYMSVEASLSERVAYRRAHDSGRSVSETSFASLNNKAALVAQEIVDYLKN